MGTGVVNAILSVLLIHSFGLTGVAWGTLIPIAAAAFFILYPAACRRVVSLSRAIAQSVLPALWPASPWPGCSPSPASHPARFSLLHYRQRLEAWSTSLFFTVAIGKRDRADYVAKVTQVTRRRRLQPAEGL